MQNEFLTLRKNRKSNVILVADDDRYVRTMVKAAFMDMAEVIEAKSGDEVLPLYQNKIPDLVLLDIHMPGKEGRIVLRELIGLDSSAHVVMVSADAVADNVRQTHLSGAKAFIVKPFAQDTLMKYALACPTLRFAD